MTTLPPNTDLPPAEVAALAPPLTQAQKARIRLLLTRRHETAKEAA